MLQQNLKQSFFCMGFFCIGKRFGALMLLRSVLGMFSAALRFELWLHSIGTGTTCRLQTLATCLLCCQHHLLLYCTYLQPSMMSLCMLRTVSMKHCISPLHLQKKIIFDQLILKLPSWRSTIKFLSSVVLKLTKPVYMCMHSLMYMRQGINTEKCQVGMFGLP